MKFIFDFDDVLFNTSKNPKNMREHIYSILEKTGVPFNLAKEYIEKERWNQFSLKKMLAHFSLKEELYKEIMHESKNFVNKELLEIIKKIGKSNCYIVSYGDEEFKLDKINRSAIAPLFSEILIVQDNKKDAIEKICAKHKDEKVIFIDDKARHFEDLDFQKYPNLQTILFDEQGLQKLMAELD